LGHIRLGRLPRTRNWNAVVALLQAGAPVDEVASAASDAAKGALSMAAKDPLFLAVVELLAQLPQEARGPGYHAAMEARGIADLTSVPGLLAGLADWIDSESLRTAARSDIGEIAQSAFLAAMSDELGRSLPSLFDPTPADIRRALGRLSSGDHFASLARGFFAGVVQRTLNYYLSRELSNHVGGGGRFATDAERVAFDRALAQHAHEAARIVEAYAGGWYGKTLWQGGGLTTEKTRAFTSYDDETPPGTRAAG
jgi:hypothetical protein